MQEGYPMTDKREDMPSYLEVAAIIEESIRGKQLAQFPSLNELKRQFRISTPTAIKVVHTLADNGLIDVVRGKKTVIKSEFLPEQSAPQLPPSSTENVAAYIEEALARGEWTTGMPLPKVSFFTNACGVSAATVCKAFTLLEQKDSIHKQGKFWIAGSPPKSSASAMPRIQAMRSRSAILIFAPTYKQFKQHRLSMVGFYDSMVAELEKYGISAELVIAGHDDALDATFPTGKDAMLQRIVALGEAYKGVVVPNMLRAAPNLGEWIEFFLSFKKPVIWLDHDRYGQFFDRKRFKTKYFFRFAPALDLGPRIALEALHSYGHRIVVTPFMKVLSNAQWHITRNEELVKYAAELSPPIQVKVRKQDDFFPMRQISPAANLVVEDWLKDQESAARAACRGGSQSQVETKLQTLVMNAFPSLKGMVRDREVTAIIAPNQAVGINYMYWMSAARIRVPEEMSVIAFDNRKEYFHYPLSIIDWGYSTLGYRAAAVFTRAVPTRHGRWGSIVVEPSLRDRGSVAAPDKSRIR